MLSNAVWKLDIKSWRLESLANEMRADNGRLWVRRRREKQEAKANTTRLGAKSFVSSPRRDDSDNT